MGCWLRRIAALCLLLGVPAMAIGATVVATTPAHAESPLAITSQITDHVDAIAGQRQRVQTALDNLADTHGLQLFVVYVDNFSGVPRQDWVDQTAVKSQLGVDDALLAVATGERLYGLSVDQNFPLTDAQLNSVMSVAIEPALRKNDWAAAAVGAADGLGAAIAGRPIVAPAISEGVANPSSDSGFPWGWVAAGVGVAGVGAGGYVYARSRNRRREHALAADLAELDKQAGAALVRTDDAVRTSEQELGFAAAQFTDDAVEPFATALQTAKADLTAAFALRQQLDDAYPEDEATRRQMLTEILQRCQRADETLDAQAAAFDKLRDLERNIPGVLAEVRDAAANQRTRIAAVHKTLTELQEKYADSATATVESNDDQAGSRLDFAAEAITVVQERAAAGDDGAAAVRLLAAQESVGQAEQLLTAVERLAADLAAADSGLRGALDELKADLLLAEQLATSEHTSPDLAASVATARSVLDSVTAETAAGRYDPLAATRRLAEADAALDHALAAVRDAQERATRARAALDQAILAARSEIAAADDYIATRRGGVGTQARTRLAEARRYLDQALALAGEDPASALNYAQQAQTLAAQASRAARSDVGSFGGTNSGGGGFGGMSGAVLGGILIDSMLRGGAGSRSSPGPTPASYGGSGTRARRGGGGRF